MKGDDVVTRLVPGYDSLSVLRRGQTAVVYRALRDGTDAPAALKVFRRNRPGSAAPVNDEQWAVTLGLGAHPHILEIFDAGVTSTGRPYVAMQYCPDGSYADILAARGPLPVDEVVQMGTAVVTALTAAHAAGQLHRAVTPGNVLRGEAGALLADFPVCRAPEELSDALGVRVIRHLAPEILEGSPASPASDIYALASTMWTLLAGYPPFADPGGAEPDVVIYRERVLRDPAPMIRRGDVPDALQNVLSRAMARDPDRRFGDGEEFALALSAAAWSAAAEPKQAARPEPGTTVGWGFFDVEPDASPSPEPPETDPVAPAKAESAEPARPEPAPESGESWLDEEWLTFTDRHAPDPDPDGEPRPPERHPELILDLDEATGREPGQGEAEGDRVQPAAPPTDDVSPVPAPQPFAVSEAPESQSPSQSPAPAPQPFAVSEAPESQSQSQSPAPASRPRTSSKSPLFPASDPQPFGASEVPAPDPQPFGASEAPPSPAPAFQPFAAEEHRPAVSGEPRPIATASTPGMSAEAPPEPDHVPLRHHEDDVPPGHRVPPVQPAYPRSRRSAYVSAAIGGAVLGLILYAVFGLRGGPPPSDGGAKASMKTGASPSTMVTVRKAGGHTPRRVRIVDRQIAVVLTWEDASDGAASHYVVGGPRGRTPTRLAEAAAGTAKAEISGLNPTVDYCFAVVAILSIDQVAATKPVCTTRTP
ncbi:protein kinase [Actinomadura sp. SCN-SB]|uniref:serine/threonine-protein kinase n=1 Tax=Actinomadura sp. SCN-SB TaxID=3373092 RepID=UPI0037527C5A